MNNNFDVSNQFAQPTPFNLEAVQQVPPQAAPQNTNVIDALRALGLNTGGGEDTNALLRMMIDRWAQQMAAARANTPRPAEEYMAQARAKRYAQDPVGAAISDQNAEMATHSGIDWFKRTNRVPELSPEEIMASQGNTAANQWMSLRGQQGGGGGGAASINPEELRRLNAARASSSYYVPQGRYV